MAEEVGGFSAVCGVQAGGPGCRGEAVALWVVDDGVGAEGSDGGEEVRLDEGEGGGEGEGGCYGGE